VLIVLAKILFPVDWLFTNITRGVNSLAGHIWKKDAVGMTQEELKTLIDVGENEGALEAGEKTMLYKLFEFGDLHIYDIMRHRSLIKAVSEKADRKSVIAAFSSSGFSRLPVYGSDSDTITGVIHYKSVLFRNQESSEEEGFARSCMQPVLFIPETLSAIELLLRFKKEKTDFAVALNEHGSTAGIVTVTDLMRAVFGRMTDEDSLTEIPPEQRVKILPGGEFIIPGDMKLRDLNELLGTNLESDYYTTLGGWLLEKFDALPSIGRAIRFGQVLFIVEDQLLRRIVSVRIKLL
jgi:putative hemolysin